MSVIVISTHSARSTLSAVNSLLAQRPVVQIVVVNTGSGSLRQQLKPVASKILLVETSHRLYAGGARNLGLRYATAPIVGFLADDCLATTNWVRRRLARHAAGHRAVSSALRPAPSHDGTIGPAAWACYALMHWRRMPETPRKRALCYGLSYDRQLFAEFGLFREDLRVAEDSEFNRRFAHKCPPHWEKTVLTLHRYPHRLRPALRDQFKRGRRVAAWNRVNEGLSPLQTFGTWRKRAAMAREAMATYPKEEATKAQLQAAMRLVPLLALAYGLGALSLYLRKPNF